jgi:RNA polymerase sigma-B factor
MTTFAQPPARQASSRSSERTRRTHDLFEFADTCDTQEERSAVWVEVIEMYLDLAHGEAARYRSRGIPLDDLRQVAALALTRATRRYDVSTGHDFLSYAVPTIRGELRKHFRDHGWMVRPTRRIQELQARISVADAQLTHQLGRSPRPVEIATALKESLESVIEALASDGCFTPASLDFPTGSDGDTTLGELLPGAGGEQRAADARLLLRPVLGELEERDRQILGMRFYEGLTQQEIGQRLGITQMQVSRLLARILGQLRDRVGDLPDDLDLG